MFVQLLLLFRVCCEQVQAENTGMGGAIHTWKRYRDLNSLVKSHILGYDGVAHFGRMGLETIQTDKIWSKILSPGV